jgi:hypothetical protein
VVDGVVVVSEYRCEAEELAGALIEEYGSMFGLSGLEGLGAQLFTGPLGELNGSLSASPDGLRGRVTLAIE